MPDAGYRERYPWHAAIWEAVTRDTARLPHALLLHGPEGLGKRAFAWRLAHLLLCPSPTAQAEPCGGCASCRRFAAGTHPDLLHIGPLEDSKAIGIDQVRDMRAFVALTPHTAARKVVILHPAEAMNMNAANALLKVLEEPPASSVLVLVTPQIARLPATVRSRCQAVALRLPAAEEARRWLAAQGVNADTDALLVSAGGAPLRALALARSERGGLASQLAQDLEALRAGSEDPLRCAARWKNHGAAPCLDALQHHLARTIKTSLDRGDAEKNTFHVKALFRYLDVVSEARSLLGGPLDEALLLEDILIGWARLPRTMV